MKKLLTILGVACLVAANSQTTFAAESNSPVFRNDDLRGVLATYSHAPRLPDGRVDIDRLIRELVEIHANTYSFAIHGVTTDWEDLQKLLPRAREHGIRVWGSIVPPSESPPTAKAYAEPFRLDYVKWATEFAKLSVRETNLVAWSIDDFSHNLKIYTPDYVSNMLGQARAINPKLAFVPCCYFKAITPQFTANYGSLLDGILFPYRHDSATPNLKEADLTEPEVRKVREVTGNHLPIFIDVYATAHSRLGKSTPEYVEQVMTAGHASADGVMVYCHQDPVTDAAKYQIVKRLFTQWAAAGN